VIAMADRYDKVGLREEYFNKLHDLQYKRRRDTENYIYLVILGIYFMEYFTNPTSRQVIEYAPFIPKIINIEDTDVVVKAIDDGLQNKGKLKPHIEEFKELNKKPQQYFVGVMDNFEKDIDKLSDTNFKTDYFKEVKERTKVIETNNLISLEMNEDFLGKQMKQWNTQRDERVRNTTFHNGIDRQVVEIDKEFDVQGIKASYPADGSLPPFERYNCRCYLTYY
jgi:hypothetical protein